MGLITGLLTFPVTGPIHGFRFILEQIREQALAELMSEEQIQTALIEASMQHQAGQISDEEYQQIEEDLFQQLKIRRQLTEPEPDDESAYEHEQE